MSQHSLFPTKRHDPRLPRHAGSGILAIDYDTIDSVYDRETFERGVALAESQILQSQPIADTLQDDETVLVQTPDFRIVKLASLYSLYDMQFVQRNAYKPSRWVSCDLVTDPNRLFRAIHTLVERFAGFHSSYKTPKLSAKRIGNTAFTIHILHDGEWAPLVLVHNHYALEDAMRSICQKEFGL